MTNRGDEETGRAGQGWVHHDLKVDQPYFEGLDSGAKTFEVRLNDRHFQPGDTLVLHEGWRDEQGNYRYTGRSCRRVITYILRDYPALAQGYVVLAIQPTAAPSPVPSSALLP